MGRRRPRRLVRKAVDTLSAPQLGQVTKLVDGSAAGVLVELSARLADQLSLVALGAARDGSALVDDLTALVTTCHEAVTGYAGLRLTLVHRGHPVRLTAMLATPPGTEVVTSLRLALTPVSTSFEEGGRLVVWSTVAGSLVDLAADLGYVFGEVTGSPRAGPSVVELDADLPPPTTGSGIVGLDELATIHRATGVLIAEGQDPASAHETLRVRAARDGLSSYAWSVRLLDEYQAPRPRPEDDGPHYPSTQGVVDRDV